MSIETFLLFAYFQNLSEDLPLQFHGTPVKHHCVGYGRTFDRPSARLRRKLSAAFGLHRRFTRLRRIVKMPLFVVLCPEKPAARRPLTTYEILRSTLPSVHGNVVGVCSLWVPNGTRVFPDTETRPFLDRTRLCHTKVHNSPAEMRHSDRHRLANIV